MRRNPRFGLSCAISTPISPDGSVDIVRLADHAQWCLSNACNSITLFGSTGEGSSFSAKERLSALDALIASGTKAHQVIGAVLTSAAADAAEQMEALLTRGCRAVLLAPPYYFKGISDEGLFAWFGAVFDRVDKARDVILYHIPQVTHVPVSSSLVTRLRTAYPEVISGIKDSSGDWTSTSRYLSEQSDFAVLVGDERQLARAVRQGADGSICGMANLVPERMAELVASGVDDETVLHLVNQVVSYPVTAAVKTLMAEGKGDPEWRRMRPPLVQLEKESAAQLVAETRALMREK